MKLAMALLRLILKLIELTAVRFVEVSLVDGLGLLLHRLLVLFELDLILELAVVSELI